MEVTGEMSERTLRPYLSGTLTASLALLATGMVLPNKALQPPPKTARLQG